MSATTLLIYSATTGHVLAAATVAESPTAEVNPESLAGKVIPIRVNDPVTNTLAVMQIPARELGVLPIEAQNAPIGQIHTITVVNPKDKKLGTYSVRTVVSVKSKSNPTALEVTISGLVTEKTSGLLLIEQPTTSGSLEPEDIQSFPFVIDAGKAVATFAAPAVPLGVPALVLVSGLIPSFMKITI
jgi:predicted transcriptional regulator